MSSDAFLRHVLDEIAAEAPFELRRSEQVWARHRRTRRRAAGLAAAVVVAVVTTLLVAPSGAERQGLVSVPTTPSASPASASATPGEGDGAAPGSATPPGRTATPAGEADRPASRAVAPALTPAPQPRPAEQPAGVFVYAPSHANPGGRVAASLYAFAWDNWVESATIDWGDGTPPTTQRPGVCLPPEEGRHQRLEQDHTYAAAGEFHATVTVRFGGCGRPPQVRTATFGVLVDDEPLGMSGRSSTNVTLTPVKVRDGAPPRTVALYAEAIDADSFFDLVFVDWGDGTATLLPAAGARDCPGVPEVDPAYPAYLEHTYPQAGTYEAHIVGFASTCDGVTDGASDQSTGYTF